MTLWRKLEHDLSVQKKVLACTYWNMIRKLLKVFFLLRVKGTNSLDWLYQIFGFYFIWGQYGPFYFHCNVFVWSLENKNGESDICFPHLNY